MNNDRLISALLCMTLAIGLASGVRADAPALIPVQGFLADAKGAPVQGTHRVTFSIFNAKSAGKLQHTDDFQKLDITNGAFVAYLGSQSDLDLGLFHSQGELWLEVVVDGTEIISPRMQLGSVPYAATAQYCSDPDIARQSQIEDLQSQDTSLQTAVDSLQTQVDSLQAQLNQARPAFAYDNAGDAAYMLTAAWMALPGVSASINLTTLQPVLIGFSLSVFTEDDSTHCNFRFSIDGTPYGNGTYGNVIAMGILGQHWQSVADFLVQPLGVGTHTVTIEAREEGGGTCIVAANGYATPALFAIGFPQQN